MAAYLKCFAKVSVTYRGQCPLDQYYPLSSQIWVHSTEHMDGYDNGYGLKLYSELISQSDPILFMMKRNCHTKIQSKSNIHLSKDCHSKIYL